MEGAMSRSSKNIFYALAVILLTALDQFTKILAVEHLQDGGSVTVIPHILSLYYLENKGAAFGIFQNGTVFFAAMTVLLLIFLLVCFARIPEKARYIPMRVIAIAIAAGAIGNLIDRIVQGYVVDFFQFTFIQFPIFNVADIYVTVSAIILFILVMFYYTDEDFQFLSQKSHKPEKKQEEE